MKHLIPIYEYEKPDSPDQLSISKSYPSDLRAKSFTHLLNYRFNDTYNESHWLNILKILERDCGDFLVELKQSKRPIFRGIVGDVGYGEVYGMLEKIPRKDRHQKDMKKDVSDEFDEKFSDKFGYKLRSNGIFGTKDHSTAMKYGSRGEVCMVFPVDGYKYFWNPYIKDLYYQVSKSNWYGLKYKEPIESDKEERERDISEIVDGYIEGDLENIGTQEITIICDKYYVIDDAFLPKLLDYLD